MEPVSLQPHIPQRQPWKTIQLKAIRKRKQKTLQKRKVMTANSVCQKSSIIAVVSITLFVISFSEGRYLRLLNQDLRIGNNRQSELNKNILGQMEVLDHSKLHQGFPDNSKLNQRIPDESGLDRGNEDQSMDQQSMETQLGKEARSKPTLRSDFRPKRAVFDILPEGSPRATGGRRISFERRDDQLLQFSKRKEEKDRMKSMLKKYFKTLLNNKKQTSKRYSNLRVCRFTFMKVCQRIAQIGK